LNERTFGWLRGLSSTTGADKFGWKYKIEQIWQRGREEHE
jgi:hypothetical protein